MSADTYLYLIRHGEAKSKEEDPERGLTERGATNAKKAGGFLKQLQIKITSIRHSGKKRAEQTAQILATAIGYDAPIESCEGLSPNDDISIIKKEIKKTRQQQASIIIVGHLPHLSRLASDLLTDEKNNEIIHFRNVGIVCLAGESQNWKLEWMVTPEIMY